jgi:hypothetical protein
MLMLGESTKYFQALAVNPTMDLHSEGYDADSEWDLSFTRGGMVMEVVRLKSRNTAGTQEMVCRRAKMMLLN